MTQRSWLSCALLCGLLMLLVQLATAAEFTPAHIPVYCSPNGGATDAVVREVSAATQPTLAQRQCRNMQPAEQFGNIGSSMVEENLTHKGIR